MLYAYIPSIAGASVSVCAVSSSSEQMEALKKQYEDLGMEIPKSIQETLANADLLGAMTAYDKFWGTGGDVESVWKVAQGYIVNEADYEEIEQTLRGYGWELPEAVAEELETAQTETLAPAIDGMYAYSNDYLNEPLSHREIALLLPSRGIAASGPSSANHATWGLSKIPPSACPPIPAAAPVDFAAFAAAVAMFIAAAAALVIIGFSVTLSPEAAIPLDGSSNAISLWERVGKLLGVFDGGTAAGQGEELYNGVTNYQTTNDNSASDESTDSRQFVFSPQIEIKGNASREDVEEALNISMEQFRELMEQYIAEKARVSFA